MDKVGILILVRNLNDEERRYIEVELSNYGYLIFIDDIECSDDRIPEARIALVSTGKNEKVRCILRRARKLEFIQTLAAGVDSLPFRDIPKDVLIASNAGANAREVAEYAFSLLLASLKYIPIFDRYMRSGRWLRKYPKLLDGLTILILGYGNIGRELTRILRKFNVKIVGVNRTGRGKILDEEVVKIDYLYEYLPLADVVFVTLPLTKYTKGFINKEFLKRMKKDGVLINVGRGEVINQYDLYIHLKDNPSFIAALDVWWRYPSKRNVDTFQDYPFHKLDNVIMTPHVAGTWPGFRLKLIRYAVENIVRYLKGETVKNIVSIEDYL